jgi:DnaJ domain
MFLVTSSIRLTFLQPLKIHGSRFISSTAFQKTLSIPFKVDKSSAEEAFKSHHSKHPLLHHPISPPPIPVPVYIPYYIFSATASLTYSARLGNTAHERRYNIFSGRWEYYPRTRYYDIPEQTLSPKFYPETTTALHIYAGYDQVSTWLPLNTEDVLSLAGNYSLTSIDGTVPRVEEFSRPIEGVETQVFQYLHYNEEERARKYLQRTYDPDDIKFITSQLNATLSRQQIYIPVWSFQFSYGKEVYFTYIAGWNGSSGGPVFYHPGLSGVLAGLLGGIVSVFLFPGSALFGVGVGVIIGFSTFEGVRQLPRVNKLLAGRTTDQYRQYDRTATQRPFQRESTQRPYQRESTQQQQRGQQQQQRGQQQRQQQTQRKAEYPSNDAQGLYRTLEVSPTASDTEIHDAFRRLARKYHPDMVRAGDSEKQLAKEKFQEISAAYEVLKDSRRRREYDRFGTVSV